MATATGIRKKGTKQPKASFVILNKTLIESEDQLKSWLDEAERQIREKLSQGPVRIN